MDIKEQMHPDKLEQYSFLWSQGRLILAAIALLLGGIPPLLAFNPIPALYMPLTSLLTLAWIISGIASVYMLYRWNMNGRKLFGAQDQKDTIAFFVSVVSGINLGLTGLLGNNIGMSISSNRFIFGVVAALYVYAMWHLNTRYNASGKKIY